MIEQDLEKVAPVTPPVEPTPHVKGEEVTQSQVDSILAATASLEGIPPDSKLAARVVLMLKRRHMLDDVDPKLQMELAEEVVDCVGQVFGTLMGAVARMATAKTFSEQQREIVRLTDRLVVRTPVMPETKPVEGEVVK